MKTGITKDRINFCDVSENTSERGKKYEKILVKFR